MAGLLGSLTGARPTPVSWWGIVAMTVAMTVAVTVAMTVPMIDVW
jgi:hypothetical protein